MKNRRILGEGVYISNDTHGLNNNDLIIGASGAGKTRSYVIPNLFATNESKIVADTKNTLFRKYSKALRDRGFIVETIDFVNPRHSTIGYNPFSHIRTDHKDLDIRRMAESLCPVQERDSEPIWSQSGQMFLEFAISYVQEMNTDHFRNFASVEETVNLIGSDSLKDDILKLRIESPGCLAERIYPKIIKNMPADRMFASILGFVNNSLNMVSDNDISQLYTMQKQISFEELANKKMVLFLNISDTDRTREALINTFYTQAFQVLIDSADQKDSSKLTVPVRFLLDDFASNVVIPDFDKIISVIRSRNISVSILLQSITQLYSLYDEYTATTIVDNCSVQTYMAGSQSLKTAEIFATKMNKLAKTLLSLPLDKECIFISGQEPMIVNKYDLCKHEQELVDNATGVVTCKVNDKSGSKGK